MNNLDLPPFDEIAVSVVKDQYGKFSAFRLYLMKGAVVERVEISLGRAMMPALRLAQTGLDQVAIDHNRKVFQFEVDK